MKKVAIVGYTETKDMAPFADPSWEIWGMNDLYKFINKYDRWFEIHGKDRDGYINKTKPGRTPWEQVKTTLAAMQCPVYLQEVNPEIPNSVQYPLEEIVAEFGQYFQNSEDARYFTNTVAYMIALAIYEKYDVIHVYGVDMAVHTEYESQRPSCEFWLGVAIGRGIKVHIPVEADLLKVQFLYGYEDAEKDRFRKKVKHMIGNVEIKMNTSKEQKEVNANNEMLYLGASKALKELMMSWD